MSSGAREALEYALDAYVDECSPGDRVTSYLIIAATDSLEGDNPNGYTVVGPETQPTHVSQGLAAHLSMWISKIVQRSIGG